MLQGRLRGFWLGLAALVLLQTPGWAEMPRVLATGPADNGFVPAAGEEFFVRFSQPVDHMQSRLVIKRGDSIVATLQPRLKTEPNVLFARSSGLPAGNYTLVWIVRTLDGQPVTVGEIAFKAEGK